jgi:hypothetical protein
MKLIKCRRSILILISFALIFALSVMTSIAQEKEIRDFLKSKVTTSVPQATAETLGYKTLNHVTKMEVVPVSDVEGHAVAVSAREGVTVFQNGEWAWHKVAAILDLIKGAGTVDQYITYIFLDGATVTTHVKGTIGPPPAGVPPSPAKLTGDIIHGTGRFQVIKGTHTISAKPLPLEKGELGAKALTEGTLVYTLPGK